ncbi:hypothetical protein ATEG_08696 [Paecilomyces variotii No. 5]|uniref:Oligopeptide transporter n=1 Tax=Byssochlamys spectabilis (strain No. 5 / NBRC 109023) TaxID=1356009 RepID=V5FVW6_BYSSN|nr:hypothetical protein ATEG_08696 [Paecilomyces variotii No. 5]
MGSAKNQEELTRLLQDPVNIATLTNGVPNASTHTFPIAARASDLQKRSLKDRSRSVYGIVPTSVWVLCIVELGERFCFYGISTVFQNYVARPLNGSEGRGALGMGHQAATGMLTLFRFWCYASPVIGAVVADQYLGRLSTILLFSVAYLIGLCILSITSLPTALENGLGIGGFSLAIFFIGLGTGGIKSNISPLIADQSNRYTDILADELVDRKMTLRQSYMIFYAAINIGSFSGFLTPYLERDIGFWSAYLVCTCVLVCCLCVIPFLIKELAVRPVKNTIIRDAFWAVSLMVSYWNLDAAYPSWQSINGKEGIILPWDDSFAAQTRYAVLACRLFVFFPIYWAAEGLFSITMIIQAGQMRDHGIPNDLLQNISTLAVLLIIPLFEWLLFPFLQRLNVSVGVINRITMGFVIAGVAMAYASFLQHVIYSTGPCYEHPRCESSVVDGVPHGNHTSVLFQIPTHILMSMANVLVSVSGFQYAYEIAPLDLKSFVQSLYMLTLAIGSVLGGLFIPAVFDPAMLWLFVVLAFILLFTAFVIPTRLEISTDAESDRFNRRGI